jgi:hypothetical protein
MDLTARKVISLFTLSLLVGVSFCSVVSAQYYYPGSWCKLTVNTNFPGAGIVTPGSGSFYYGDLIVAREYTNPGYSFDGWYLNGVYQGKLSSIPISITRDYNLLAVFSKRVVSLTINANPVDGGTVAPGTGVWNYTYGDSVIVREYENTDHQFIGWYLDGDYQGAGTSITVSMSQDHQLNAFFAGESVAPTPTPAPAPIPSPTQQPSNLPIPDLTFYCTSSTTYSGFNVKIDGALVYNQVGLSGAGIMFSYSVTGGATWQDLAYVKTIDDGTFSAVWMPSASGNYLVKATWLGDNIYSPVSKIVSFAVQPSNNQAKDTFSVASNSSLSSLKFDSSNDALAFSVSGPSGTSGYVQVCVPKTLLKDATNLKVTLDGNNVAYQPVDSGDVWVIIFTYHHSSHNVVIALNEKASGDILGSIASGLQSWVVLVGIIVVLVAAIAVLLVLFRRKPKIPLS